MPYILSSIAAPAPSRRAAPRPLRRAPAGARPPIPFASAHTRSDRPSGRARGQALVQPVHDQHDRAGELVVEPAVEGVVVPVVGPVALRLRQCFLGFQRVVDDDEVGAAPGQHAADRGGEPAAPARSCQTPASPRAAATGASPERPACTSRSRQCADSRAIVCQRDPAHRRRRGSAPKVRTRDTRLERRSRRDATLDGAAADLLTACPLGSLISPAASSEPRLLNLLLIISTYAG